MFIWFIFRDIDRQDVVQRPRSKRPAPRSRRTPCSPSRRRRASTARRRSCSRGKTPRSGSTVPFLTYGNAAGRARSASPTASTTARRWSPSGSRARRSQPTRRHLHRSSSRPAKGKSYTMTALVNDKHGQTTQRRRAPAALGTETPRPGPTTRPRRRRPEPRPPRRRSNGRPARARTWDGSTA